MAKEELIAIHEFCVSHNVERSFIYSLYEAGLVEMTTIEETAFISDEQVPELEKLVRLIMIWILTWKVLKRFIICCSN